MSQNSRQQKPQQKQPCPTEITPSALWYENDRDRQQQSIERSLHLHPDKNRELDQMWVKCWSLDPGTGESITVRGEKCRRMDPPLPTSVEIIMEGSGTSAGTRRPQTSDGELSADEDVTATVKDGVLIVHTVHADAAGLL
jgi:hypothetical protein